MGGTLATRTNVEAEGLHFLDENVKRFRGSGFEVVIAFDDRLINPGAALNIV